MPEGHFCQIHAHIYVCKAVKEARFGRAMGGIMVFVRKQCKGLVSQVENTNCKFGVS